MTSATPKSPLTALTGFLSFVLIVGGGSGLLHEWFGWIQFLGFVRFLVPDGYEIYGYIVMIALGLAIGTAGDVLSRRDRS